MGLTLFVSENVKFCNGSFLYTKLLVIVIKTFKLTLRFFKAIKIHLSVFVLTLILLETDGE